MKTMLCPLNGRRNISEFDCAGEIEDQPDPNACSDEMWTDYIFLHDNTAGLVLEWWCHVPTSYWFIAERHTLTDEIVKTYPAKTVFKTRIDFHRPESPSKPGNKF